ncbi:MAG: hypothetical protein ACTHJO_14120 [Rhodanobacter sp.]
MPAVGHGEGTPGNRSLIHGSGLARRVAKRIRPHERSGPIRKIRHGSKGHEAQDNERHPARQQLSLCLGLPALRQVVGCLFFKRLHYRLDPLETFRLRDRTRFDPTGDSLHFRKRIALPLKVV